MLWKSLDVPKFSVLSYFLWTRLLYTRWSATWKTVSPSSWTTLVGVYYRRSTNLNLWKSPPLLNLLTISPTPSPPSFLLKVSRHLSVKVRRGRTDARRCVRTETACRALGLSANSPPVPSRPWPTKAPVDTLVTVLTSSALHLSVISDQGAKSGVIGRNSFYFVQLNSVI